MKTTLITLLLTLSFCTHTFAQTFNYADSTRRVLVSGATDPSSLITINEEIGYWKFKDELISNGGARNGALQISDLGEEAICAKSYAWDYINGSFPNVPDSQTSLITSFTLLSETHFKINFSGMGHFSNNKDNLFFEPVFFLKSGLTGSGGTVLQMNGSGIEYINLAQGDYRVSSAIGTTFNCRNDPDCHLSFAYQSSLSMTTVDLTSIIGESFSRPFTPDHYLENENVDIDAMNADGAFVIRGNDSTFNYTDKPSGWFDIGGENQAQIEMQSIGIITELQLPENRLGTFKISVENVFLGDFSANDIVIFSDYSSELNALLVTGLGNSQGVKSLDIIYEPINSNNISNSCGQSKNTAVKLQFDENIVSFDAILPHNFIPDFIYSGGFEG